MFRFSNIIGITITFLSISSDALPKAQTEEKGLRSQFNIGSCVWVIERPCPDTDIHFYLFTKLNPNDRQLIYVTDTWEKSNISISYFNRLHPVKIIIHGYNSDMFLTPLIEMKDQYLQRGDYNLFYVDWSSLAPGPCYPSAVHNSRHVGKCISQLIERVIDGGTFDIHLIGFSLGAQVTNFVAKELTHFRIPRITGLDPAMPLFITASTENKLDESDAEFVDIIHTNAFVQGKIERCGHVDFYLNGGIIQPGCWRSNKNPFACSHHRAPEYFTESILSYDGFWGWQCSSYVSYLLGMCPPTNNFVLAGEDCKSSSRGLFLITTNSDAPYATGRWTESLSMKTNTKFGRYGNRDPFQNQIDQWGKLDGEFNNIDIYPTRPSQNLNYDSWPHSDDGTYTRHLDYVSKNVQNYEGSENQSKKYKNSVPQISHQNNSISINSKYYSNQKLSQKEFSLPEIILTLN